MVEQEARRADDSVRRAKMSTYWRISGFFSGCLRQKSPSRQIKVRRFRPGLGDSSGDGPGTAPRSGHQAGCPKMHSMASMIEAIEIKRKMYFEYENAPYHCLDVDVSKPTARGGQTLVRLKMRNLLTRAVFDKTFKAGEKFREPDLEVVAATYLYGDAVGHHFMDQGTFDTLTLRSETVGDDSKLL